MKMNIKRHHGAMLFRAMPVIASVGTALYALLAVISSGLAPAKYSFIAGLTVVIISLLIIFLWFRWFESRKKRITSRIVAVILMLIVLILSTGIIYVLNKGLSTLNRLTDANNAVTVDTSKSFNIFISGIDTYGDISTTSRSDVNIVATVNPLTHKILLTTTPRDSYVSIAGGGNDGMDKLTHAGIYGPEASVKTVARLFDTSIDTYVRINFTSFIESIDSIGGITVDNPVAFTIEGQSFPVGKVQLDGKRALLYSRERKSLEKGDVDRGKNQERVIQGIVDKMTSVRSLNGFEAILEMIGGSIDTNMSQRTIKSLINQQIDSPASWKTESYEVSGVGQTGGLPSYAMPNSQLYMYVLDDDSVSKASDQIKRHMEAKV